VHDEKVMISTLQKIAIRAQMELKTTIYKGNSVTQENIKKWLKSLQGSSHDVVLFYFSGHGCKDTTPFVPWPKLFFSARSMFFSMKTVIKAIEETKTRLSLIVSDCCNGPLSSKPFCLPLQSKVPLPFRTKKGNLGAQALFKKARGHIRAVAASPGQNALAFDRGSVFTLALSQSLSEELAKTTPSWERVFQSTKTRCGTIQTPYISLDLQ